MITTPFDRWRASCQPGLLPSREKLDALQPGEIVGVRADVLRQLVVQAANHDADGGIRGRIESLCVLVENRMMATAKPSEIRAAMEPQ